MDEMVRQTDQIINFTREINRRIGGVGGGGRRRPRRTVRSAARRAVESEPAGDRVGAGRSESGAREPEAALDGAEPPGCAQVRSRARPLIGRAGAPARARAARRRVRRVAGATAEVAAAAEGASAIHRGCPTVSYNSNIQPLFNRSCATSSQCHGPNGAQGLDLTPGQPIRNTVDVQVDPDAAAGAHQAGRARRQLPLLEDARRRRASRVCPCRRAVRGTRSAAPLCRRPTRTDAVETVDHRMRHRYAVAALIARGLRPRSPPRGRRAPSRTSWCARAPSATTATPT